MSRAATAWRVPPGFAWHAPITTWKSSIGCSKLLETDSDLAAICRYYEVDTSQLGKQLTAVIDRLKTGNARSPALSPQVVTLMRETWMTCSIEFGSPQIRSGHLLCALLSEDSMARLAHDGSRELEKISCRVTAERVARYRGQDGRGGRRLVGRGGGRARATPRRRRAVQNALTRSIHHGSDAAGAKG